MSIDLFSGFSGNPAKDEYRLYQCKIMPDKTVCVIASEPTVKYNHQVRIPSEIPEMFDPILLKWKLDRHVQVLTTNEGTPPTKQ